MRKVMAWILIALMALQCAAFAEGASVGTFSTALNGADAVKTATDIYFAIPAGEREMLVRVPLAGGEPVCLDRADRFEGLMPYAGGAAYLKTIDGASTIMRCNGNEVDTIYGFGAQEASGLSFYGGKFLVLMDGLLHSIEPGTQVCLKLSGTEMLDYVLGEGCAYFLSAGDRMEYTAQLGDGETASTQAGCVYRLDLNSGETTLLLKSGGRDLKILGDKLYFHNLADAYAVRTAESTDLLGRVYSLDVQLKTLDGECTEPDSGFWPTDKGLVAWYNGALNLDSEAGTLALYAPENGATVVSDGSALYVWESGKQTLTAVQTTGTQEAVYAGDLTLAKDASLILPEATVAPSATAPASDEGSQGNSAWFDQFMENKDLVSGGSSGSSGNASWPQATPIGSATPRPTATPAPDQGGSGSSSGSGSSGSSGSSGGSSSSGTSAGSSYSVDISYLKITGGNVNIRSKGTTSASILGSIPEGTIVSCLGLASKDSGGSRWYKIKYNGTTGWVSAQYAKKSSAPDNSYTGPIKDMDGKYVKVIDGDVTIRKSPNKTSANLGAIAKGTTVTFLGKYSIDARGVKWYKIKYDGTTGWVSSRYAEVTNSSSGGSSSATKVKVVGGNVTIRAKANKTSDKLGYIAEGNTAKYLGKSSTDSRGVRWYYISYDGVKGWVSSRYTQLA